MTGSASTGKSFMTHQVIHPFLKPKEINYLLISPTGVAAQNIGGTTIHPELKIRQTRSYYEILSIYDENFKNSLLKVEAIIIEEISMVSGDPPNSPQYHKGHSAKRNCLL